MLQRPTAAALIPLTVTLVAALTAACSDDIAPGPSAPATAAHDVAGDLGAVCEATEDCPCEHDDDCVTGVCARGPDGEKKCAKPCGDGCPDGWKCVQKPGKSGVLHLCLPDLLPNCVPFKEICDGVDNNCNGRTDELFCDDGNPCTDNVCDPQKGAGEDGCVAIPWDAACEDGDLCTIGDTCKDGACVTGTDKDCSDKLPCTINGCDLSGECTITLKTGPCDDGDACTTGDSCVDGLCQPGAGPACDDDNACTDDACNPLGGCTNVANSAACEDGDPCTPSDTCKGGKCVPSAPVDCDDGNVCTTNHCDPILAVGPSNGCTATVAKGLCDDGDPCTKGDVCIGGKCDGGGALGCDDNNPCTKDGCDEAGKCSNVALKAGAACDDGNACTSGDACTNKKQCVGKGKDCDDKLACTHDSCDSLSGLCLHAAVSGGGCSDGDPCTIGDVCQQGQCTPGSKKLCDDAQACTTDSCDAKNGACVFTPTTGSCDDGDLCTTSDLCSGGVCAGKAVACAAPGPCQLAACDGATGKCAENAAVDGVLCDDGDPCSVADRCLKGKCAAGPKLQCDDANPCTADSCATAGKCAYAPKAGPCDDGNPCTKGDTCSDGSCKAGAGACACQKDADCAASDDGNPCNGTLYCALATHTCEVNSSSIVACDKSKDTACAKLQCAQKSGVCEVTPTADGAACDADGSPCTVADSCKTAVCVQGPALGCDDSNPCTVDSCQPPKGGSKGGCANSPKNGVCSDGDACTLGDACVDGKCQSGPGAPSCNDGNPCTLDRCVKATGACAADKLSGPTCTDGNACTTGDVCQDGACKPGGVLPPCPDSDPCKLEQCNPKNGKCVGIAGPDGAKCDDGNPCTAGDACKKGKCAAGEQAGCAPPGPCVLGKCDKASGKCVFTPAKDGGLCNDGDACSLLDACLAGKCIAGDGQLCNDGDPCTLDVCDKATGKCSYPAGGDGAACDDNSKCTFVDACKGGLCVGSSAKNCGDGNDCTADTCDAATGECQHAAAKDGTVCNDGSACTGSDVCTAGKCGGKLVVDCQTNACQKASCDPKTAKCSTFPQNEGGPCDDGVGCTKIDVCKAGKCGAANPASPCDDDNACTVDSCDVAAKACVHVAGVDGGQCDDDDLCTFGDTCKNGACVPKTKTDCDDNNPCNEDTCDQQTGGCLHKAVPAFPPKECNDGNACTADLAYLQQTGKASDLCKAGKCQGQPISCNDNNPCTDDSCAAKTGCKHTATGPKPCSDGNACTTDDACSGGVCKGKGAACVDGNPCTTDGCDKGSGCTFTAKSGPCDDGSVCTTKDACAAGACKGGALVTCDDGNPCTDELCHPKSGCASTADDTNKCSDGDPCTSGEACKAGKCGGGGAVSCDDGSVCTTDSCKATVGCQHVDNGTKSCDDGNACTGPDACKGGKCLSTGAKNCDDGNGCTTDVCQPATGCVNIPTTAACDDGDACTVGDACSKGACVPGKKDNCDDGSACTTDTCDDKTGCAHQAISGKCDDGNPCTTDDVCGAGVCAGKGTSCDDGNACTKDSCALGKGCNHDKLTATPCDDGDPCTLGDACKDGQCAATGSKKCDDGDVCTADECEKSGCSHPPATFGEQKTTTGGSGAKTLVSTQSKPGQGGLPELVGAKIATVVSGLPGWAKVPGGQWIWHEPAVSEPTKSQTMYVQHDFAVDNNSETLSGQLQIAADNAFSCWLNGKLVGATDQGDDAWGDVHSLELGAALQAGNNQLVCAIHNIGKTTDTQQSNKAGVAFSVKAGWYEQGKSPACDDGNGCTGGDACAAGKCKSGWAKNCDDHNPCTTDSCDVGAGCQHAAADNNPCNDGSICSVGDHCKSGKCAGKSAISCDDGNACTLDKCHNKSGCFAEHSGEGGACDDGDPCTLKTVCSKGACGGGEAKVCDDSNPCTKDQCAAGKGCQSAALSGQACNDGNPCTDADACEKGACVGKAAAGCDDGNVCTTDSCGAKGCQHTPADGGKCDDGSACTTGEKCASGACAGGKAKECFDTLQCTLDSCDAKTGKCVFQPLSDGDCDDGNLCTLNDGCSGGACKPGPVAPCGDGNTCTTDGCDPGTGKCLHTQLKDGTGCDDGNACTSKDRCGHGQCQGDTKSCDDNNACTTDSCAPSTGVCSSKAVADGAACGAGKACLSGVCL